MDKMAEIKQRKREKLLALVGNKAPTMGQVNPNHRLLTIDYDHRLVHSSRDIRC